MLLQGVRFMRSDMSKRKGMRWALCASALLNSSTGLAVHRLEGPATRFQYWTSRDLSLLRFAFATVSSTVLLRSGLRRTRHGWRVEAAPAES